MSTRGVFGFHINGQDKVTACEADSRPYSLGASILNNVAGHKPSFLRKIANDIEMVNHYPDQYHSLCNAHNGLTIWLDRKLKCMVDGSSFLINSLWCEYAYIVNLDDDKVEFYRGFTRKPSRGRYGNIPWIPKAPFRENVGGPEYWGVRLVSRTDLGDARSQHEPVLKRWDRAPSGQFQ